MSRGAEAVAGKSSYTRLVNSRLVRKRAAPYLFLLPFLALYFVLIIIPIFQGLYVSLTDWDMMSPEKSFVGLKNFEYLFFGDPLFWLSVKATFLYILINVPVKIVLGLILALALNQKLKGMTFHRSAIFLPFVINIAAVGLLFQWILDPQVGMLNYYLPKAGLAPQHWLVDPTWTMEIVVLVTVWWSVAFNAIVFLAGLQAIPEELYEAARIDGGNAWQRFWHVTLPCLKGTTLFVTVMQVISSFVQAFGNVYMLTEGGPNNVTRILMIHLYETGFYNFEMGPAAAIGVILLVMVMALTAGVLFFFRGQVEY